MKTSNSNAPERRCFSLALVLVLLAAAIFPAAARAQTPSAEGPSRKEKIHITAESLEVNDAEKYAEFIGSVKAVQGTTEILSDRLKIFYEGNPRKTPGAASQSAESAGDSIKKIVATGNVKITFDDTVAESREAVYTTADRILVLSGPNSKVTKPASGEISGSRISINRESGQIKFDGNVQGVFFPGEKGLN